MKPIRPFFSVTTAGVVSGSGSLRKPGGTSDVIGRVKRGSHPSKPSQRMSFSGASASFVRHGYGNTCSTSTRRSNIW